MSLYDQKAIIQTPEKTAKTDDTKAVYAAAKGFYEKSEEYQANAEKNYSNLLNMQAMDAMNELYRNPSLSNNPTALKGKITDTLQAIASEIPDDNAKINFLAGNSSTANSLVNKAFKNAVTEEAKKFKDLTYADVYGSSASAGDSFANILSGVYDQSDFDNFLDKDSRVTAGINAKGQSGADLFSTTQKQKMINDYNKSLVNSFEVMYGGMTKEERKEFTDKMDKGEVSLGSFVDKKTGKETNILLKDRLPKETYLGIQSRMRNINKYFDAIEKKELKAEQEQSVANFLEDPTGLNRKEMLRLNPKMKEEDLIELEEKAEESPNYECTSTVEAKQRIDQELNRIFSTNYKAETDGTLSAIDSEDLTRDIINLAKVARAQNKAGVYSKEDTDEIVKLLSNMMTNSQFRNSLVNIAPDREQYLSTFIYSGINGFTGEELSERNEMPTGIDQKHVFNIYDMTTKQAMTALMNGDEEGARKAYKKGTRMVLDFHYPEAKGKEIGDTFIRNGVAYQIEGFGSDIIVKILK